MLPFFRLILWQSISAYPTGVVIYTSEGWQSQYPSIRRMFIKDVYIGNLCLQSLAVGTVSSCRQKTQTGKGALLSCSVVTLERLRCACEVRRNDVTDIHSPTNF